MFGYLLAFVMKFAAVLTSEGVRIKDFRFAGSDCVEIFFFESYWKLEIIYDTDENGLISIYIHDPNSEEYKSVSFIIEHGLSVEQFTTAFITLVDIDKFKPAKKYFFTKLCKKCGTVYFKREINKVVYQNQLDNDNIQEVFSNYAQEQCIQLESTCEKCSS